MNRESENIVRLLKNRLIFFTGIMGSGKSTVGRQLASELGIPFHDLDEKIIEQSGRSIGEIFSTDGEEIFRELESQVLTEAIQGKDPMVMALGGGALIRKSNMDEVQATGILINLYASPESIAERLNDSQITSLMVMLGKSNSVNSHENIINAIIELIEKRKSLYDVCDFAVCTDGKKIEGIVVEILERLRIMLAD
jgi:shikimate kinase